MMFAHDEKWQERFLGLARTVSMWSKDSSTKVGAVIADWKKDVISLGYNGFPAPISDVHMNQMEKQDKYDRVIHAEMNAILRAGARAAGAAIYITAPPCVHCAKHIVAAGLLDVIFDAPSDDLRARWGEELIRARNVLAEAHCRVRENERKST